MPKFLLLILVSLLLLQFISSEPCPVVPEHSDNIEDEDDCKDLTVSGKNKACCFLEYSALGCDNCKTCFAVTAEEVKDNDKAYDRLKKEYPGATGLLICSEDKSAYLVINLLSFLLLTLL